jgi:putative hydrolase of the HAD superfamily
MLPDTVLTPLGGEPFDSAQRGPYSDRLRDVAPGNVPDWNIAGNESADAGPMRRGLIVDLDDTLYAREEYVQSGLMAVARYVEDVRSVSALDAFRAMTAARRLGGGQELQALCAHFGWDEADVATLLAVYRGHEPALRLPRDSAHVLSVLRRDGWRVVVLTNGLPQVQRAKVAALGLRPLVDAVIYAEERVAGGKPSAAAFRAALNALGVPAGRCVCAGDDLARDIAGARVLGIRTVWVTPGFGIETVRLKPGPTADAQIASIADLPTVLAQLLEMAGTDAA